MFISESLGANEKGHLTIGGADAIELAREFGTPLCVMDENLIRKNARLYKESIDQFYGGKGIALYASKAFCCKAACRLADEEGLGLDVVSGGELATAIAANFPAEKICFHGNYKTPAEIEMALEYGIGRFVVDNELELITLNDAAAKRGVKAKALVRITPGVDAHTHDFIMTGKIDSKFGVPIEKGAALKFIGKILEQKNIELMGLHCHIGSQIFDLEPFCHTAEVMLDFMAEIKKEYSVTLPELNLGGGFGIKYTAEHDPIAYDKYIESVERVVAKKCAEHDLPLPYIYMEPGRSLVGEAGTTLYTVGSIKEIEGVRTYVAVDGGMTDNPRYALYEAEYTVAIANKINEPKSEVVTIAGRCCESGDLIQENAPLQKAESGDILAVFSTGAYNYSMASNYNRVPRPAVVFVKDGKARLVIRRETYQDVHALDMD